MQKETKRQSGPVLATLKVLLVLFGVAAAGLAALMVLGLVVGPSQAPSPDRIRAECASRFAEHGDAAVDACVKDLLERVAEDERQRLLDDAYRASKRPAGQ